ncbi:hypothetical protein WKI71_00035 [Streptomyces sp. MS1.AVA.1]|uniref:Uncharacterized protein n=1 Tax=Streptomyces machairae TaxID=3134109 RepID=A0ABU8UF24_9ACTN
MVGAVTSSLTAPAGRHDDEGRLPYPGPTAAPARAAGTAVADLLASGRHCPPWTGWPLPSW